MLKTDIESTAILKTKTLTEMQPSSDEGISYSSSAIIPNTTSEGTDCANTHSNKIIGKGNSNNISEGKSKSNVHIENINVTKGKIEKMDSIATTIISINTKLLTNTGTSLCL